MAELVGITVDVKNLSRAFYTARKSIRLGIERGLTKSGPKLLKNAKSRVRVRNNRLKTALKFKVAYSSGDATLAIVADDPRAKKYMWQLEQGGDIYGNPLLAFVPEFSPFYSKSDMSVAGAEQRARAAGYQHFFRAGKLLLGVRRQRRGPRRKWVKVGAEYAPIAVITEMVSQKGHPYIQPAFTEEMPDIQQRIIAEIVSIFNGES